MDLRLSVRRSGNVTILDVRGRVTFGAAGDSFKTELSKLVQDLPCGLVVNLTDATQIDSSGIGALVQCYVTLARSGSSLVILNPVGSVREVLEVTHLHNSIPVYPDEARALASFHTSSKRA